MVSVGTITTSGQATARPCASDASRGEGQRRPDTIDPRLAGIGDTLAGAYAHTDVEGIRTPAVAERPTLSRIEIDTIKS